MEIKLFGTKIKVTFLFISVITSMIFMDRTGLILPLIFSVIIHEGAHLLAMHFFGVSPKEVLLLPGSILIVNYHTVSRRKETVILILGPLANFIFFALFYCFYLLFNSHTLLQYSAVQLLMCLFNLLIAKGLDGGALLYNLLLIKNTPEKAELKLKIASMITVCGIIFLGIFYTLKGDMNISIFILAIYLLVFTFLKN